MASIPFFTSSSLRLASADAEASAEAPSEAREATAEEAAEATAEAADAARLCTFDGDPELSEHPATPATAHTMSSAPAAHRTRVPVLPSSPAMSSPVLSRAVTDFQ
ncbi:hypothetical protein GCM10022403_047260 [Streptomyces coacervatus]|uniref:Uncharacterized protein n=1 Tax=Streptomyces coacervatus TaxID=647381 RepID=A0ABP7I0K3_9ACTN